VTCEGVKPSKNKKLGGFHGIVFILGPEGYDTVQTGTLVAGTY